LNFRLFILLIFITIGCKKERAIWENSISGIISSSSPQCIDLNQDGIKDIIMGAGGKEWEKTESGIVAIDGKNGQILWQAKARNQLVGSAIFLDINQDKSPDVIIGGRSAELQALNGKTGKLLWEFYSKPAKLAAHDEGWYNFFNPQLVLDQDNDGIKDLIVINGGDALIAAGAKGRPAATLLLLSGKTGKILASDTMPDGAESYSTPVCFDCDTNKNPTFIFGTGGETQPGHLYLTDLNNLKIKQIATSKIIDKSSAKGYIAPPILADFNNDHTLDILVNMAEGKTKLFDGKTHKLIWELKIDSAEVYSQPAVGYFFGDDKILDVFVNFAIGTYPTYSKMEAYLINGKNGKIVENFHGKRFTYSSPLVADLDQDGVDEVILNTILDYEEKQKEKPYYQLTIYNFAKNSQSVFADKKYGACFASTPWLGDLDADNHLDLIYTGSPAVISEFPGITTFLKPPLSLDIFRYEFSEIPSKSVKWGNYLGPNSKSIFGKPKGL
jgi:outer membrane protein assembly factor BamB